ncbi:MAG: oligosaccharide flippase family protein [Colwellia sp.]|nr:oligosaccharide flippase family protein [Colwellia sp.]
MASLTNSRLLKKGSVLLMVKLMASALALAFHYLLAKQLDVEQFGLLSLAMTVLLFSSAFAKQGLEQVSIRFIAKSNAAVGANWYCLIVSYAFISACIIALLVTLFAQPIAITAFSQQQLALLLPLVALLTVFQTCSAINSSALKAKQFTTRALFISGFITFVFACLLLINFPVDSAYQALLYFTYSALISSVISFVMLVSVFKKQQIKIFLPVKFKQDFFELIQVSKYIFVISLMALATGQLSILILSSYVSLGQLGSYSIALKLSLLISYPLIIINAITAPQYAKLHQRKYLSEFKQLAFNSTKILFVLGSLAVLVLFFSVDFILAYFGQGYVNAAIIVKILLVGQWFNLATGSVVSMLIMSGYEKVHQRNTVIITSINIFALFIFIPLYGLLAGAIITSFAMAIKNVTALYYVNKLIYQKVTPEVSC